MQSNSELCGVCVSPGVVQALKQELIGEVHVPLSSLVGISLSARAGAMLPLGSPNRPSCIADRFFLGGVDSMRGFSIKGIGPNDERRALPEKGELATDSVTIDKDSLGGDILGAPLHIHFSSVCFMNRANSGHPLEHVCVQRLPKLL